MKHRNPPLPRRTNHGRAAFQAQLRQQARHGINWATVDSIVGTREDLSFSGVKHRCTRCGQDVYVGRTPYPEGMTFSCEVCAVHLAEDASVNDAVKS